MTITALKESRTLMHDDTLASQAQQEWEAVADLLRGHTTRLATMPDLKPEEVVYVLNVATAAMVFDLNARTFDSRLASMGSNWGTCEH